ncbi:MAG: hypothetical protein LBO05_10775, partial [Deltaproteobacteria bacterium]|nr:hypothetical protein [Deltaproteobacteria bacterium]
RNLRLFPPVTKKNKVIHETVMAQIETEVSKAHVESSRGKVNPRGVKKKMSSFRVRKRGELLNQTRDIAPEVLEIAQPRIKRAAS